MQKLTMVGIAMIVSGAIFVFYSVVELDAVIMNTEYLTVRTIMILGFVMLMGGGLITLSPFGRR
ncbi:hypothetical protein K0U27_04200 [archaeon]|nr:hypothetical protein [archaeon]